jgi:DNA sulfur modification protein DndD
MVGLSGGETQVLAFCFVGSIVEIQREHAEKQGLVPTGVDATEYPIVMDSPYGQLGMAYRTTVSDYIPMVTDQVIVLVTDSQWEGATARSLREKSGKSYVLMQHATAEKLAEHHLSSIALSGREYPFVVPSTTGYEWTEIVGVNND